jgi:uncharacterized phiE125 gp8 family phage protein
MGTKLILPPATQPLTLNEVKAHLRVDHNDEDNIIDLYLKAATRSCELFTGRAFVTQRWMLVLDNFPPQIQVPKPPLQTVVSFVYDDAGGVETQIMENTEFFVDNVNEPGWIVPVNSTWPTPIDAINSVRVTYDAGYGEDEMPDDIRAAILLTIGTFYEHRETQVVGTIAGKLPFGAEQLLRQYLVELSLA